MAIQCFRNLSTLIADAEDFHSQMLRLSAWSSSLCAIWDYDLMTAVQIYWFAVTSIICDSIFQGQKFKGQGHEVNMLYTRQTHQTDLDLGLKLTDTLLYG